MCSTPCGITDSFTTSDWFRVKTNVMCSTPCGITDSFTLDPDAKRALEESCSTPCGITDSFTSTHRQDCVIEGVLNALRHHG